MTTCVSDPKTPVLGSGPSGSKAAKKRQEGILGAFELGTEESLRLPHLIQSGLPDRVGGAWEERQQGGVPYR